MLELTNIRHEPRHAEHVTFLQILERALGSCPSELFLNILVVDLAIVTALRLSAIVNSTRNQQCR